MKHLLVSIILIVTFFTNVTLSLSQSESIGGDSLQISVPQIPLTLPESDTARFDSLSMQPDSLSLLPSDTIPKKQEMLETTVFYTAQDSIVFTKDNKGFLYGKADVKYQTIAIEGELITMDMDSSIIGATFGLDSVGKEFGYPTFDDKGTKYEMKGVRYNFKTERAYISDVVTEQGEGYIVANQAKKNQDNSFYMVNAKYTTCDNHDHPHFYLNLSKAKVRPGEDVVTGPAWLVVADVPLFPLVLPFAFFPFNETYSSGIIMPSYGDEMQRGFYLHNGGYYFAISDYVDLALTGEIYTKGSWGVGVKSNYRKRYKFSGNMNANYLKTILGDKGLPDYSASTNFRLSWTHSQDPKANMYRTLSASVNYSTSSYNQHNMTSRYSREATNNTKSSTVNLTQRFPDSPFNISASASVNQVSRDSTISATLPNLSINMSRIYPLKRKNAIGEERWYEKITMSYSGEFRNSIHTKESDFFDANIIRDWKNGMRHSVPISATFTLLDYINISPSFNYNERWYTSKEMQDYNPETKRHSVTDTIYGFNRVYDYSTSLSVNTKLYGMYKPWQMFGDKVQAIRHVFSPSISLSYRPDFGASRYNYYETYSYKNEYGEDVEYTYSPYSRMMFGTPSQGEQGNIGFDFKNNVEMKIRSESDTTGYKKVSLIDDLGINFSYNMMADSMKWSMINTNMRLKLSKSYTLSLNATWDPYLYEVNENGRPVHVDKLRVLNGKGFGRLYSTGTSFSYSINQDTFGKLFNKDERAKDDDIDEGENMIDDGSLGTNPEDDIPMNQPRSSFDRDQPDSDKFDEYGYMKPGVTWNLSFNYSLRYGYDTEFDFDKLEYKGKLTHSLGINGALQPTENWSFTFNTDYNFDLKKLSYVNCTLTRDLHCWSMSASFIPIGPYKSYNFIIRAKSSLLQDLKYEQRSSQYQNMEWY
ncbi:MAG TPA: putative LPS assembly protein LptD [Dysgonamonadaceae bacterium]|nr:putative LPS assembly protein LptD [Dysgonamonadaceae bacterium]